MRHSVLYMAMCCAALLLSAACESDTATRSQQPAEYVPDNSIILDIAPSVLSDAGDVETAILHIDVLIFGEDGGKVWNERATTDGSSTGRIILSAPRDSFTANALYWVYLVANSTAGEETFDAIVDLNALRAMTQADRNIHLTGLDNITAAPEAFLMDAAAYPKGEPEPPSPGPVVLYNGNHADNTELDAVLRRAAAKIEVHIYSGANVTFDSDPVTNNAGYYISNMPYTTSVVAGVDAPAELRTPQQTSGGYFDWSQNEVTVTAYTYAHEWANASSMEQEVRLVVNLPLTYYDSDGTSAKWPQCFYQIPVSRDKILERNTVYRINITVNAPGAVNPSKPVELETLTYDVHEWIDSTINIGGEENRPKYLTLNMTELSMDNTSTDSSLHFSSSSEVSVSVEEVYYIDKFGQRQDYRPGNAAFDSVNAVPESGLDGYITVTSAIPVNNATRYIVLNVTNADGLSESVLVAQSPLETITNIQGWYSYRSDFGGTTYELLNGQSIQPDQEFDDPIEGRTIGCNWDEGGWGSSPGWEYSNTTGNFFTSKVATQRSDGTSRIAYYQWRESHEGWWFPEPPYSYSISTSNVSNLDNARMYHVRISASSGEYSLGRPRLDADGYTDDGADNAELVSPSFMIASQLGATQPIDTKTAAAQHCREYVEVYSDDSGATVHLDDWRLPTRAELEIIMKFQYRENAAMDEVLSGRSYWSASGLVGNTESTSSSGEAIRCVRDNYDESADN